MLRLPLLLPVALLARAHDGASCCCPLVEGIDVERVWCLWVGEDDSDSLESEALRRREISTVAVRGRRCRQG